MSPPFGTRRMSSSTSSGAGITNVPVPQCLFLVESISQTLGKPLWSASFSCQVFFFLVLMDGNCRGKYRFDGEMVGCTGTQHACGAATQFGGIQNVVHATAQSNGAGAHLPGGRVMVKLRQSIEQGFGLQPFDDLAMIGIIEIPDDQRGHRGTAVRVEALHLAQAIIAR